ncbi:MAG TPA: electron transfer flavoprotein subunit beta/FixA family protein [Solirubrobacteraceae bacterium]|nr:electron transfer flavoprotein subunit beta/FixA family protein [Solirubrobacteraceae bacterium]
MKILVPVKVVASLDEDFALKDATTIPREALEWQLNEWDSFSLEAALQLSEGAEEDCEVVAVTVGGEQAEQGLRSCLAKGADRAIRVWDDSLEGADALAVAFVLAAVARAEQPQLVLSGVQSSDAVESATGIALAGLLDLAHVAVVTSIELVGDRLRVARELEGGVVELLSVSLPCLLTVQTGINEPRYATLRAIKHASAKPLAVSDLGELGLDAESVGAHAGSRTLHLSEPVKAGGATMLDGGPPEVAARIATIIREAMGA